MRDLQPLTFWEYHRRLLNLMKSWILAWNLQRTTLPPPLVKTCSAREPPACSYRDQAVLLHVAAPRYIAKVRINISEISLLPPMIDSSFGDVVGSRATDPPSTSDASSASVSSSTVNIDFSGRYSNRSSRLSLKLTLIQGEQRVEIVYPLDLAGFSFPSISSSILLQFCERRRLVLPRRSSQRYISISRMNSSFSDLSSLYSMTALPSRKQNR